MYIENQYFTSPVIAEAIARRLKEPHGPEFVIVLPRDQTGWIEESTMGLLRSEALRTVEAADRYGRFRAFYPVVAGLEVGYVKIHSKVMIIDDVIARIGSANLNNRSMGLDTECDLTFEALGRGDVRSAIASLRAELLSEHLNIDATEFEARFLVNGSFVDTVDSFLTSGRSLVPMHPTVPQWVRRFAPPKDWIDPRAPNGIRRWTLRKLHTSRHLVGAFLIIGVLAFLFTLSRMEEVGRLPDFVPENFTASQAIGEVWQWTRSWNADKISISLLEFRSSSWALPSIFIGFIIGSLLLIPLSAMILGVALAYQPAAAIPIALGASLVSASFVYAFGRWWAFTKSRVLNRPWVNELSGKMKRGGVMAVATVRLAPIAPFAAVGIVAGGLRIPFVNYLLGTLIGLLPGVFALSLIASRTTKDFQEPVAWATLLWVVAVLILFAFFVPRVFKSLRRSS